MDDFTTKPLRLFYALWPDDACRAALAARQTRVEGRRIPYQNLHLTLVFLGEQSAVTLPVLHDILAKMPTAKISILLDRMGYFPRKQIAWAGMHQVPDALYDLRQRVTSELTLHRISFDHSSDFKPHVTLARDAKAPDETAFAPIHWTDNRLVLVQSSPGANGPSYRILRPDESTLQN